EDGIRDLIVTGVQTCALPISSIGTRRASATATAVLPTPVGPAITATGTFRSSLIRPSVSARNPGSSGAGPGADWGRDDHAARVRFSCATGLHPGATSPAATRRE